MDNYKQYNKHTTMKKTFIFISITIILFSISYIPSQAQEMNPAQVGLKAGLNLSNLYTEDATNSDMKVGFNVGVFAKMPVSDFFAIQPELYYTTKGGSVTYNTLLLDGTANFNLSYIEVPLLFVLKVTPLANIHFGPYVSYLLSGKATNKDNINLFDFEDNINVDNYNRIDAGIAVGAGIDAGPVTLGARYNLGLTKVGKERTILGNDFTIPNSKNGVINFYIAVSLN